MYGTAWKEERTEALTRQAIDAGFRAIDTANQRRHYFEAGVGAAVSGALRDLGLSRSDFFLQTKFTYAPGQDHRLPYDRDADFATQVAQSFESSLEHLQTDYVDSYVLHGPWSRHGLSRADEESWTAMEAIAKSGKARLLGVSNVSLEQLDALVRAAEVKPAFVQNRCYARTGWDRAVRALCERQDIVYQGFSLLTANDRELRTSSMRELSQRTGKSPAQLVFRFALEVGMLPLTGTTSAEHLAEDLGAYDFELAPNDVDLVERIAG
jgi:diketogulonate reductase-like aldo/keto reductase